eukprot:164411_1
MSQKLTQFYRKQSQSIHKRISSFSNNNVTKLNHDQSIYQLQDWKTEEEEKYNEYQDSVHTIPINHYEFVVPNIDDFMHCSDDFTKCAAIHRIIHLLQYYKHSQRSQTILDHEDEIILLYEYIISLPKYSISSLMEDWYHSKEKHFKSEKCDQTCDQTCFEWFQDHKSISCQLDKSKNCIHIDRHERQRERAIYNNEKEIDYKNIILRDHIDSIHAFIFHSATLRSNSKFKENCTI